MVLKHPTELQQGKTAVYFVRHGDRLSHNGMPHHPGPGLSDLGKKQAQAAAQQFARMKNEIDVLYSSSMTRALETAAIIGKAIHKKPQIEHHLCEVNKILWTRCYHAWGFWKHLCKYFLAQRTFNQILRNNQGKVIIIVAHGGIIRALFGWKYGISLWKRGALDHNNCHITFLSFRGTKLDYIHYYNSKGLV